MYVGNVEEGKEEVCGGRYQLVYFSPEALLIKETWRDMLLSPVYQKNLVFLLWWMKFVASRNGMQSLYMLVLYWHL